MKTRARVRATEKTPLWAGMILIQTAKRAAKWSATPTASPSFPLTRFSEHGVALASARAGNVIGGGDWTPRQLIPDTIAAFLQSQAVVLRHPQAVRPWQHVLDCLAGYLTLAEALADDVQRYSGAWNFGPADEDSRPVRDVVETLASHWGIKKAWVQDDASHPPEEQLLTARRHQSRDVSAVAVPSAD